MADLPVTVITTCTSRKAAGSAVRAERLYTGEQHRRLMQGVDELRRSLRRSRLGSSRRRQDSSQATNF